MPTLAVRAPSEVPSQTRASKVVREQQALYEDFIKQVPADHVGELELTSDEQVRGIKVRLRRASTRLGVELEVWDSDDRVYFAQRQVRRRGRPRKS